MKNILFTICLLINGCSVKVTPNVNTGVNDSSATAFPIKEITEVNPGKTENLESTQNLLSSTSTSPGSNKDYLYKDILVELEVNLWNEETEGIEQSSSVDLDNITHQNLETADFVIIISQGSQTFIVLKPINGASAFIPDQETIDYYSCKDNFANFTSKTRFEYISGEPICILTTEGRIGIVRNSAKAIYNSENDAYTITMLITVFSGEEE